jgi:hypothetical protein
MIANEVDTIIGKEGHASLKGPEGRYTLAKSAFGEERKTWLRPSISGFDPNRTSD